MPTKKKKATPPTPTALTRDDVDHIGDEIDRIQQRHPVMVRAHRQALKQKQQQREVAHEHPDDLRRFRAIVRDLDAAVDCRSINDVEGLAQALSERHGGGDILASAELVDLIYAAWLFYEAFLSRDRVATATLDLIEDMRAWHVAALRRLGGETPRSQPHPVAPPAEAAE
jgi:hypothetical protein